MTPRQPVSEMIAEGMRECGVLVLVFGMLDKLVHDDLGPSALWTAGVLVVGLGFFAAGCILERTRP